MEAAEVACSVHHKTKIFFFTVLALAFVSDSAIALGEIIPFYPGNRLNPGGADFHRKHLETFFPFPASLFANRALERLSLKIHEVQNTV
jgi:hypothetical protein